MTDVSVWREWRDRQWDIAVERYGILNATMKAPEMGLMTLTRLEKKDGTYFFNSRANCPEELEIVKSIAISKGK